jgi:hypothetical protein
MSMKTDLIKDWEEDIQFKKLVSRKSIISRQKEYHWREINKLHGEVKVTNMYDTIIHHSKFTLEPVEVQKGMLSHWREIYKNTDILKEMGISSNTLSNHLERLGIPKKQKTGGRRSKAIKEVSLLSFEPSSTPVKKDDSLTIIDGFRLNYNGVYGSEEINKILTKLQLLVDGEESKYKMSITLEEVTK